MTISIYECALSIGITIMLFMGILLLCAKIPHLCKIANYILSKRIMAFVMLILTINYIIHLTLHPGILNSQLSILMNLSTYFLITCLFNFSLKILLDKTPVTKGVVMKQFVVWISYSILGVVLYLLSPIEIGREILLWLMSILVLLYAFILLRNFLKRYKSILFTFKRIHSDDSRFSYRGISLLLFLFFIFLISSIFMEFLPNEYVYIPIFFSIIFYICIYISYHNYLMTQESLELNKKIKLKQLSEVSIEEPSIPLFNDHKMDVSFYRRMSNSINEWISKKEFTQTNITVISLAKGLYTNRTYLSDFIRNTYGLSFKEWIINLRMEYAKELLINSSHYSITKISKMCGYKSTPHFTTLFNRTQKCTPLRWRKENQNIKA